MARVTLTKENELELVNQAIDIMREGGLVVYPTDTTYGLGADATNADAVRSVYRAKGRPSESPLSVSVPDLLGLRELAHVDTKIEGVLSTILPGAFTVILPSTGSLPHICREGRIGIRIPACELSLRLCGEFPITCTSANLSGKPSPRSVPQVTVRANLIIDAGPSPLGLDSTVVDLSIDRPRVIRRGSGDLGLLRGALEELGLNLSEAGI